MDTLQLLGSGMGLGLLAGIRLYATVLLAGAAIRFGWIDLPAGWSNLDVLADGRVLSVAAVACLAEFLADKIAWVDSVWDSVHAFIRPVGAALLGSAVFASSDPAVQTAMALLCGGVALTGHSTKAAARLMVNQSPEPFSNVAVSLVEDVMVSLGTWLVLTHPTVMLALVAVFLAVFALISPILIRAVSVQLAALRALIRRWTSGRLAVPPADVVQTLARARTWPERVQAAQQYVPSSQEPMPAAFAAKLGGQGHSPLFALRVVGSQSIGMRNSTGYLCFTEDGIAFIAQRNLRLRVVGTPATRISGFTFKPGLLIDWLIVQLTDGTEQQYGLFKDASAQQRAVVRMLQVA